MSNINKMNFRSICIDIFCFVILLFPFNSTIASKIYPQYSLSYISVFVSLIGLLIFSKKQKNNRISIWILIFTILFVLVEVITNKYVNHNKMILFSVYSFLPFVVSVNKDSINGFKKSIKLFSVEHIFFTYLATFCKGIYKNYILPFLDSAQTESLASSHFKSGFNPGLTTHYSTNGMYLAIISIFFWVEFLNDKKRKSIIPLIVSLGALFLTGKRGHVLFTIITFIILYFITNRDKFTKKVIKFIFAGVTSIIILYVVSCFIPQIMIGIERFNKTIIENGDLLTGREEFYLLAINLWKGKKFFGNGWGAFSNYYQLYLSKKVGVSYLDAHNVYIQLLCETGIIGAIIIIGIMYVILLKTIKLVKDKNINNSSEILFSLGYQIFFLLYCFSGNPLYDPQCYVMYFITIGIFFIYYILERKENEKKNWNYNIS